MFNNTQNIVLVYTLWQLVFAGDPRIHSHNKGVGVGWQIEVGDGLQIDMLPIHGGHPGNGIG